MIFWPPLKKIIRQKGDTERYFKEIAEFFLTAAGTAMFLFGAMTAFAVMAIFGHR
jgi:hypothetical protein